MKNDCSNVHMTSNVYPALVQNDRLDVANDERFVSKVGDRVALKKLIEMRCGSINDHSRLIQDASSMLGIQKWQLRRIEGCDTCVDAPGNKPWGYRIEGGKYVEVCRCDKQDCSNFKNCRPEWEINDAKQ